MINLENRESPKMFKYKWGGKSPSVYGNSIETKNGVVFEDHNGNMLCVDNNTGKKVWKDKFPNPLGNLHFFNNSIFKINKSGDLFVIDPETGENYVDTTFNDIFECFYHNEHLYYLEKKSSGRKEVRAFLIRYNITTKEEKKLHELNYKPETDSIKILNNRNTMLLLTPPNITEIKMDTGEITNQWTIENAEKFYGGAELGNRILLSSDMNLEYSDKLKLEFLKWDHIPFKYFKDLESKEKVRNLKARINPVIVLDKNSYNGYLTTAPCYHGHYSNSIKLDDDKFLVYSHNALWVFNDGVLIFYKEIEERVGSYLGQLIQHKGEIYLFFCNSDFFDKDNTKKMAYYINIYKFDPENYSISLVQDKVITHFNGKNYFGPVIDLHEDNIIIRGDRKYHCLEWDS